MKVVNHMGRSWLCVKVVTERQDSAAWSAFSATATVARQDQRYVSPMESGESLDRSRKEIWVVTGRDRQREKQIIERVETLLSQVTGLSNLSH